MKLAFVKVLFYILSVVVGTENREVLILNPAGSAIAVKCQLPSVPVFMAISGTLDVEYRITVACRDNNVYTVKVGCARHCVVTARYP